VELLRVAEQLFDSAPEEQGKERKVKEAKGGKVDKDA